ncbi:MAG: response regulator [Calditrichia bacterium]
MISIAIVEDNPDIRRGLASFFTANEDYVCKAAVESVEAFIKELDPHYPPEIVLMDIGLPGMSGIDGIKLLKREHPDMLFIMLTVFDDAERIFGALCAGASGYLLKSTPLQKIRESVDMLHNGGSPMSPQIARKVVDYFNTRVPAAQPASEDSVLTEREHEVVKGLVDGLSYKMIAQRMEISIDTVRSYIKRIYSKLHVNSKVEVVSKSLRGEI